MKIKQRPVKPGTGKLEKVPARRKAGGCEEGGKKKLKAKPKESLRPPAPSGSSAAAPAGGLFAGTDPRHFGARDEGARLASERLKKATRKSKVLQSALRVSAGGAEGGGHLWTVGCRGMGAGAGGAGVVGEHWWDLGVQGLGLHRLGMLVGLGGIDGTVGRRGTDAGAGGAGGAGGHWWDHGVQGLHELVVLWGTSERAWGVLRWLGPPMGPWGAGAGVVGGHR